MLTLGSILQCWSKKIPVSDPCVAEAVAINWALEIALIENFRDIFVEGDAQICMSAINGPAIAILWKIQIIVFNVKLLAASFISCSFYWVRRDANCVAHSLAKFASSQLSCFHCNNSNLPPSVHETWLRDLV